MMCNLAAEIRPNLNRRLSRDRCTLTAVPFDKNDFETYGPGA